MTQVYIKFYDVEQVTRFVNIVNRLDTDFDLGSGQRRVNAKSVLGVFALDLSKPLLLQYVSKDAAIMEKIAPFLLVADK